MEKVLKTRTKVRFQDCDPFNHLNNSKYIDYFLNTREDQILEHYGIDVFREVVSMGKSWVVVSNQISYFRPANTMESILIASQIIDYSERSILVEMKMFNHDETELKAVLWVRFVYYDIKTVKSAPFDEEYRKLFEEVSLPVNAGSFEERCALIAKTPSTQSA